MLQAATRYCMVHVDTPADTCRQWNAARPAEGAFSEAIFEDLAGRCGSYAAAACALAGCGGWCRAVAGGSAAPAAAVAQPALPFVLPRVGPMSAQCCSFIFALMRCRRFERPDSRNRWDAPLFTLRPALGGPAAMQETLEAAAAAVADAPPPQRGAAAAAEGGSGGTAAANGAAAAANGAADEEGGCLDGPAPLLQAKQLRPKSATDTPMLAGGGQRTADACCCCCQRA